MTHFTLVFGGARCTVQTLRFAWHITTVAWWGFGAMLWLASRDRLSQEIALTVLAITILVTAMLILIASHGRHLAWPVFAAIAAAALYAGH